MECEVMSKTYEQIRVAPAAAKVIGEMEFSNKRLGFYMTEYTAAMLAAAESATLIVKAESVKVTKAATAAWVAGDPIFWIEASSHFTNIDDGGSLCVGKAAQAASQAAVVGYVLMKDYVSNLRIGASLSPQVVIENDVPLALFLTASVTTGTIIGSKIDLVNTGVAVDSYHTALQVNLKTNVKAGYGFWAIQGNLDFQTNGQVIGKAAAIEAGLIMPARASVSGYYFGLDVELSVPAGGSWSGFPGAFCAFSRFKAEGANVAQFQSDGYFFHLVGVGGGGSGEIFYVNTKTDTDAYIRIKVDNTDYYILLAADVS